MPVPNPRALVYRYAARTPEALAAALGLVVRRVDAPPALPSVTVYSEYRPEDGAILLYPRPLADLARRSGESTASLEQRHIAHELYHALAERGGASPWRVDETEADRWADELLALLAGHAEA